QQLLIQRNDKSVVPALKSLALGSPDWRFRIQALATLDGMNSIDEATVTTALGDKAPEVRAEAVRLSERWLREANNPMQAAVQKKMDDPTWTVRRQLAASLGEMPKDARIAPIETILRRYGNDDVTVDAAISGLNGQEADAMLALLETPGAAARPVVVQRRGGGVAGGRAGTVVPGMEVEAPVVTPTAAAAMAKPSADAISNLAATVMRSRNGQNVERILSYATDTKHPEPLRLALLRGAASAVPGAGGGRGGGGGFGGGFGGGGGRGRGGPTGPVSISAEPAALIAMSKTTGDLADSSKQIVAGLTWPGKPAPPVVT